jgi:foldase protein PrsA
MRERWPEAKAGKAAAGRRQRAVVVGVGVVALLLAVAAGYLGAAQRREALRPVAKVGDQVVTRGEWLQALVRQHGPTELMACIDETLIRQAAAKLGLQASPERVRAKIEEAVAYLGSQEALEQRLKELHMTLAQLRARAETLVLLDEIVRRQVQVTPAELARYYSEHAQEFRHGPLVRARMMLFASRANAEAVRTALRAGGDFAGLAKALSEDPATASQGGDMGWFGAGDYAPEITAVAFKLRPGQLSGVFKGPDGWYILKVEGRQAAGQQPLAQVQEQIRLRLVEEKMLTERAAWLQAQRRQARLVIKEGRLRRAVRALLASAPPPTLLPGVTTPEHMLWELAGARGGQP